MADTYIIERDPRISNGQTDFTASELRYEMSHEKRGIALIINNKDFKDEKLLSKRHGSDRDAKCMDRALRNLGFEVKIHENQTTESMKDLFEQVGTRDHSMYDCFIAVLLSHGGDGDIIYGVDGKNDTITVTDLIEYLLPARCPSLTGKPKLFFIQACRGTKLDSGNISQSTGERSGMKIPSCPDVLIANSTVPELTATRNKANGSWFIQSLAYVLENHEENVDLIGILTRVNCKVAYEYNAKIRHEDGEIYPLMQVPMFTTLLTRQLYFNQS